jgi:hypothetical protein
METPMNHGDSLALNYFSQAPSLLGTRGNEIFIAFFCGGVHGVEHASCACEIFKPKR